MADAAPAPLPPPGSGATGFTPPPASSGTGLPAGWTYVIGATGGPSGLIGPNGAKLPLGTKFNPDGTAAVPAGGEGGTYTYDPSYPVNKDGVPTWSGYSHPSGVSTKYSPDGKPAGVYDQKGTQLTPEQVDRMNASNGSGINGALHTVVNNLNKGDLIAEGARAAGGAIQDGLGSVADLLRQAIGGGSGDLSVDTSGVQKDIDSARALREQFDAAYRAAHPGEAPKIDPTLLGPQTMATAAGLAPSYAGDAGHATSERALAALLDPAQQAEVRAKQGGLADYLNTVIAGKTPSVAEFQLKDQTQLNAANQLGLASKMSGGGNAFLALQNAAGNIGRLNADEAAKGAILRATEEEKARGQLAALLDQTRGSDITLADRNASLQTGVNTTNATNATSTSNANAGRDTDVSLAAAAARNAAALQDQREKDAIAAKNADNATSLNVNQGTITSGEKKADATNILDQRKIDEAAKQNAATNALSASGQTITGGGNLVDSISRIKAAQAKADADSRSQVGQALAFGLGGLGFGEKKAA